jgi:hypothetical protein
MSRNEAIAEALTEVAAELDEHRTLLQDIRRILVDLADGHTELRARVIEDSSRQGERVMRIELRTAALERVAGK